MRLSHCSMKIAGFGILPTFMMLLNNIKPKADPAPARPSPRLDFLKHIFQYVHHLNFNKKKPPFTCKNSSASGGFTPWTPPGFTMDTLRALKKPQTPCF